MRARRSAGRCSQVACAASFYELHKYLQHSGRFDEDGNETHDAGSGAGPVPLPEGVDPQATDTMGWTGLMHAAVTNDAPMARKLLAVGSNHTTRNRFGLSALLWAHWMDASAFREVLRQLVGTEADALDGNDQKGFDRLRETLERHKGEEAVLSLLRPSDLCKGSNTDAGAASVAEKQEDGIQKTQAVSQDMIEEDDTPSVSLEQNLLDIDHRYQGEYPKSGPFTANMRGFIQSMKIAVMDIIASGTVPQGATPVDIFALHLYTRAELFGFINRAPQPRLRRDNRHTAGAASNHAPHGARRRRGLILLVAFVAGAYRDGDPKEMEKWRVVVWYMCAAKRRLRGVSGVFFRGVGRYSRATAVPKQRLLSRR